MPAKIDDGLAQQFASMGVTVAASDEPEEKFELWDINLPVFEAFAALDSQWRMIAVPAGETIRLVRTGLDYGAVDILLRRRGLDDAAFNDVQAMEHAALAAHAEVMQ